MKVRISQGSSPSQRTIGNEWLLKTRGVIPGNKSRAGYAMQSDHHP